MRVTQVLAKFLAKGKNFILAKGNSNHVWSEPSS